MARGMKIAAALVALLATGAAAGGEIALRAETVVDAKAVYGQVLSRRVTPARTRIGGTLAALHVEEGSLVEAGQTIAEVRDEKLALNLAALDARIAALEADRANAEDELARAEALLTRGVATRQQVDAQRTRLDVAAGQIAAARAERAAAAQLAVEGAVLAPEAGVVLARPATLGAVVMPGETVAEIASGGLFLRLALPERHAARLAVGDAVAVAGRPSDPEGRGGGAGRVAKIYPGLSEGRVVIDVEAAGLDAFLVGERALVRLPVAERTAIFAPRAAVVTRGGLDFVRLAGPDGVREVAVLLGAETDETPPRVEVLSGLVEGDVAVTP